ncbi:tandem-95 repeat protein [Cellvibrio sp. pealriver]|uniref:Ig-like domain-containing protein n=1 Tax=Cellvibrio sp. pealriver TaxID=1622269 RepID=UPI00066FC04C|nr:tandem-95 repeat protein [Cellvibrio sp. pealriver]
MTRSFNRQKNGGRTYLAHLFTLTIFCGATQAHAGDLVAYWKFDETVAGTQAADSSGTGYPGTPTGAGGAQNMPQPNTTIKAPTDFPNAASLYFDGDDDYLDLPDGFADFRTGMTITLWAHPTELKEWGRFFDFGNGASSDNIIIARNGNSQFFYYEAYNGSSTIKVNGATPIKLNEWHYYTVTVEGADSATPGRTRIYVDGVLDADQMGNVPLNLTRINNYIGKSNWGDPYYKGYIDELRIYKRALTAAEVLALAEGAEGPSGLPMSTTPDMQAASDSGTSNSDNITKIVQPVFSGTADVSTTVTLSSDIDGDLGTAAVDGSGNWSITPSSALTAGTHKITAKATDAGNNTGISSAPLTVVIDTTAPAVTVNTLTTKDTTPPLSGTVNDANASVSVTVAGQTLAATNSGSGNWSLADNSLSTLTPGVLDVQATATDIAGNSGQDATNNELNLDLTAPSGHSLMINQAVINTANENALSFTINSGEVGASYTFTITSSGGGTAVTGSGTISSASQLISNLDVTALGEGTLTLTLVLTDPLGNVASDVTATVLKQYALPPVITQGDSTNVTMSEDGTPQSFALSLSATDANGDTLTWSLISAPAQGTANASGSGGSISPSYSPRADYNGNDSFVVQVSDGALTDTIRVNITITPINDAPVITGTPATRVSEDSPYTFTPGASDVDTGDLLGFTIANKPAWALFDPATGRLSGTPTNADVGVYNAIQISVTDGVASTALPAFNLEVINSNDAPVAKADRFSMTANSNNQYLLDVLANDEDMDGDPLQLMQARAPLGQVSMETGGLRYMAPAGFRGQVNLSYTIRDPSGATAQADVVLLITGESNAATPIITPPADVEVNATALYTKVDLGQASAVDTNNRPIAVSLVDGTSLYPPGVYQAYWQATDSNGNQALASQKVSVHPLVSLGKDQTASEGTQVTLKVHLNGVSPVYPLVIPFSVGGSADNNDHDLRSGSVTITSGTEASIQVHLLEDGRADSDEELVISLSPSLNLGAKSSSRITISEANIAPEGRIEVTQNGQNRLTVSQQEGLVTAQAKVSDANPDDALTLVWDGGSLANFSTRPDHFQFDPKSLAAGVYPLALTVTDAGGLSSRVQAYVEVLPQLAVLGDEDTDGDLIPDAIEGYADADGDGIPDYLDAISDCNVMQETLQTSVEYLAEGDPGVCLRKNAYLTTDSAANPSGGLLVNTVQIADEAAHNIGGLFSFIAYGLPQAGQSYNLVLPQRQPIPAQAVYRKLLNEQWQFFIQNERNQLFSTRGEPGFCPPPGDSLWQPGLTEGDHCVQLLIEDGGPNDADGEANRAILDPGGVAVMLSDNRPPLAVSETLQSLWNRTVELDVLANDSDPDGDNLSVVSASSPLGQVVVIDRTRLSYAPPTNFGGNTWIDYSVSDGRGGISSARVNLTVITNSLPVTQADQASTDDRTPITLNALANDTDADGHTLSIVSATAQHGTLIINSDQTLTYTPKPGFDGVDQIAYQVDDGNGGQAQGTASVRVNAYQTTSISNQSSSGGGSTGSILLLLLLGLLAPYSYRLHKDRIQ